MNLTITSLPPWLHSGGFYLCIHICVIIHLYVLCRLLADSQFVHTWNKSYLCAIFYHQPANQYHYNTSIMTFDVTSEKPFYIESPILIINCPVKFYLWSLPHLSHLRYLTCGLQCIRASVVPAMCRCYIPLCTTVFMWPPIMKIPGTKTYSCHKSIQQNKFHCTHPQVCIATILYI